MKTAVAIRHLQFEDLGSFEAALEQGGFDIRYCDVGVHSLEELQTNPPDLLIVLGGPIGAYEDDKYPFLVTEIRILESRLKNGQPTMGICLGSQLMARALGARIYPGPAKEIGFASIQLTEEGQRSCLRFVADSPVLHWHGDTFDLPQGATLLASTEICKHQAFAYGAHAIAFQFHPEAGGRGFERWLIGHTGELAGQGISVNELRQQNEKVERDLAHRAFLCAQDWLKGI